MADRREAGDGAARAVDVAPRTTCAGARGRRRACRAAVPVALAAADGAGACAHARDRGRRGGPVRRRDPGAARVRTRSRSSASDSEGWSRKLAEAEQLKRSFLMSVSHELRTPLTAIRGHVEAIREGDRERARAGQRVPRHRRRGDRPARAPRRRRPRPGEAPGPSLHGSARGGRPRAGARPCVRRVRRGSAASRDRLSTVGASRRRP